MLSFTPYVVCLIYMRKIIFLCLALIVNTFVYGQEQRIITLHSAITETVFGLGLGESIVATDVTSISPRAAADLPRVSQNRSLSSEGILSFKPTVVLALEGDVSKAIVQHLKKAGVKYVSFKQEYSEKGSLKFIQQVADALGEQERGKQVVERTKTTMTRVKEAVANANLGKASPKVLFIYARGTGTMSVAGKGSSLDAIITLAGAKNAVQEFADFKPYTTEALVKANPDIILLFDFGLSSLGGKDAVLKMPGMRLTEAGKNKRIIEMSPTLLVNFSTRLPEAVLELNKELHHIMQ